MSSTAGERCRSGLPARFAALGGSGKWLFPRCVLLDLFMIVRIQQGAGAPLLKGLGSKIRG